MQSVKTRLYQSMVELCTYSMNKQYVEGDLKWEKTYLTSVGNIDTWYYDSLVKSDHIQRTEANKVQEGIFILLYATLLEFPNRHAHSLREIIVSLHQSITDFVFFHRLIPEIVLNSLLNSFNLNPIVWGCRICLLHLCRGVRSLPTSIWIMTLYHLMVRFQSWIFGKCGILFHCHYFQVHSASA